MKKLIVIIALLLLFGINNAFAEIIYDPNIQLDICDKKDAKITYYGNTDHEIYVTKEICLMKNPIYTRSVSTGWFSPDRKEEAGGCDERIESIYRWVSIDKLDLKGFCKNIQTIDADIDRFVSSQFDKESRVNDIKKYLDNKKASTFNDLFESYTNTGSNSDTSKDYVIKGFNKQNFNKNILSEKFEHIVRDEEIQAVRFFLDTFFIDQTKSITIDDFGTGILTPDIAYGSDIFDPGNTLYRTESYLSGNIFINLELNEDPFTKDVVKKNIFDVNIYNIGTKKIYTTSSAFRTMFSEIYSTAYQKYVSILKNKKLTDDEIFIELSKFKNKSWARQFFQIEPVLIENINVIKINDSKETISYDIINETKFNELKELLDKNIEKTTPSKFLTNEIEDVFNVRNLNDYIFEKLIYSPDQKQKESLLINDIKTITDSISLDSSWKNIGINTSNLSIEKINYHPDIQVFLVNKSKLAKTSGELAQLYLTVLKHIENKEKITMSLFIENPSKELFLPSFNKKETRDSFHIKNKIILETNHTVFYIVIIILLIIVTIGFIKRNTLLNNIFINKFILKVRQNYIFQLLKNKIILGIIILIIFVVIFIIYAMSVDVPYYYNTNNF